MDLSASSAFLWLFCCSFWLFFWINFAETFAHADNFYRLYERICKLWKMAVVGIGVGAGKCLGMGRIFARIFPNLPETFLCNFAYKSSPTKIGEDPIWFDFLKMSSCVFLQTFGAILAGFSGILSGFSTNQDFGGARAPLPPTPLAISFALKKWISVKQSCRSPQRRVYLSGDERHLVMFWNCVAFGNLTTILILSNW